MGKNHRALCHDKILEFHKRYIESGKSLRSLCAELNQNYQVWHRRFKRNNLPVPMSQYTSRARPKDEEFIKIATEYANSNLSQREFCESIGKHKTWISCTRRYIKLPSDLELLIHAKKQGPPIALTK